MRHHSARLIAQPTKPHGVIRWGWRCECGQWRTCEMTREDASADRRAHELYPDGLGDADAALREWSRKR